MTVTGQVNAMCEQLVKCGAEHPLRVYIDPKGMRELCAEIGVEVCAEITLATPSGEARIIAVKSWIEQMADAIPLHPPTEVFRGITVDDVGE